MFTRAQLDWLQDRQGQLKVQMRQGEFRLIAEWIRAADSQKIELVTSVNDINWFKNAQKLDRSVDSPPDQC
jgi:hypothetical protein